MNTKGIVIVVIVGAIVIGSYAYTRQGAEDSANIPEDADTRPALDETSAGEAIVIEMDGVSFSPNTVTIRKNTEVVFKNIGSAPLWPASNIHPTHGIYPAFDPQRPVAPGESWSFVFDKAGTWKMHDHLLPRILGEITVTE